MNVEHVLRAIDDAGKPLVAAIDGRCTSGKTTLAHTLSLALDAPVIHMDDFFLPYEMRTAQRLAQPGGNFDLERFTAQVALPLSHGESFSYGVYDCSAGSITGERHVPRGDVVIVEGAYSMHPELQTLYGLRIFCDIDPRTQLERLRERESTQSLQNFIEKWIPMEEKYLEAFGIEALCNIVLRAGA